MLPHYFSFQTFFHNVEMKVTNEHVVSLIPLNIYEKLYLMVMLAEYQPVQSESLSLSLSLLYNGAPCGFWHLSSAIHTQDSVHERPALLQEQLVRHSDFLHWRVVSSSRLFGAGSFIISTGFKISSSFSHPCPSGEFRSCIASSECLQIYV